MEPDELGQTHISDVSEKDERVLRQLNLLEVTALYDEHHISWTRMRARKKYKGTRIHPETCTRTCRVHRETKCTYYVL